VFVLVLFLDFFTELKMRFSITLLILFSTIFLNQINWCESDVLHYILKHKDLFKVKGLAAAVGLAAASGLKKKIIPIPIPIPIE